MAETLNLYFKAYDSKNAPQSRLASKKPLSCETEQGMGNKPPPNEPKQARKEHYVQPERPNVQNYSINSYQHFPKEVRCQYPVRNSCAGQAYVASRPRPHFYGGRCAASAFLRQEQPRSYDVPRAPIVTDFLDSQKTTNTSSHIGRLHLQGSTLANTHID